MGALRDIPKEDYDETRPTDPPDLMVLENSLASSFSFPELPGWTCVDDNCYLYVREAVTWDWARKTCIEKNATLVTISSTSKNNLIGRLIKTNIWIGLNDRVEAGTSSSFQVLTRD